jgi:hypothetical protein
MRGIQVEEGGEKIEKGKRAPTERKGKKRYRKRKHFY